MEFAVVKSHSPYNVILGRTGLRSLGAVASTVHSMIKFPIANGIAIVTTKKETLHECRRMEEAQGPTREEEVIFQTYGFRKRTDQHGQVESQGQYKQKGEMGGREFNCYSLPEGTTQPPPSPPRKDTQTDEKIEGKDEHPEGPLESKPLEKGGHSDTIRIKKPLPSRKLCPANYISDLSKYYGGMPMLSLRLWQT
ncbi:hypothetical protein Tco_0713652 [Tanacetum coccineum]